MTTPTPRASCLLMCALLCAALAGEACADPTLTLATPGTPASNINVTTIEVNQGTAVTVASNGVAMMPADFNAPVVARREALVRVYTTTTSDFVSRLILGRLSINGRMLDISRVVTAELPSSSTDLSSTFNFQVPSEAVIPGGSYSVELLEPVEPTDGTDGTAPLGAIGDARVPEVGTAPLEASDSNVKVRVVVVPVKANGRVASITASVIKSYFDFSSAAMPLSTRYEVVVRKYPLVANYDFAGDPWGKILMDCAAERTHDRVDRNTFYFCAVKPADSFELHCARGCTLGLGYWNTEAVAWQQTSVGVEFGAGEDITFTHEFGHTLGLGHAPCGVEGDKPLPYSDGKIGVVGYDRNHDVLLDPTTHADFMGYCDNQWVSDINYGRMFERFARLGAQARVFDPYADRERLMVLATATPDGLSYALTLGPTVPPDQAVAGESMQASYLSDDGEVVETVFANVGRLDHSDSLHFFVPAPLHAATTLAIDGIGMVALSR